MRALLALIGGMIVLAFLPASGALASASGRTPTPGHGPTAVSSLLALEQSGALSQAAYDQYSADYSNAQATLRHLSGERATELGAVIRNIEQIAGRGLLSADRLALLFLTLDHNRVFWSTRPLPSAHQRVSFPGDALVWEYYPGQGVDVQWLATFGKANGYWSSHQNAQLAAVLSQAITLVAQRPGGIAWEYTFNFDGGPPPWTSGLAQGTAIQTLARAAVRLNYPTFMQYAHLALAIFDAPPPVGVLVPTAAGAHYLQYSFAPGERILNGFLQSLVGLYDYATLSGDPQAIALFTAGDAEARAEVPLYDTGAWSLYDQTSESDLSYHELLTGFLANLCQRTQTPPVTPAPATTTTTTTTGGSTAAPNAPPASDSVAAQLVPDPGLDAIYCTTDQRFTADLHTTPQISLLTSSLPKASMASMRVSLSKVSVVAVTITHGQTPVFEDRLELPRGTSLVRWRTPAQAGMYTVRLAATDLAGNTSSATGAVVVLPRTGNRTIRA